jgi:hypothetical protein
MSKNLKRGSNSPPVAWQSFLQMRTSAERPMTEHRTLFSWRACYKHMYWLLQIKSNQIIFNSPSDIKWQLAHHALYTWVTVIKGTVEYCTRTYNCDANKQSQLKHRKPLSDRGKGSRKTESDLSEWTHLDCSVNIAWIARCKAAHHHQNFTAGMPWHVSKIKINEKKLF